MSGKGPDWRAVAPLAISGYERGVEGHTSARIELVKLDDGTSGLAVRTSKDQCGEEDCGSEDLRRFTLKNGKLVQVGRPSRGR